MQSSALIELLKPFKLMASRGAMRPENRAVELAPDHIKACTSWGLLDVAADLAVERTVYVDSVTFLAIIDSLPDGELQLTAQDGSLQWQCGNAKGRIMLMGDVEMPPTPEGRQQLATSKEMARAFDVGALSSDENAIGADGVYGVLIDNSKQLRICATDSTTISCYTLGNAVPNVPARTTITPFAANLLAELISDGGWLNFLEKSIVYTSAEGEAICQVGVVPPIRVDIPATLTDYSGTDTTTRIPADRVKSFIKRATALAESRRNTRVLLGCEGGRVTLSFEENDNTTDEYFMAEDLADMPTVPPVYLGALKVARAMSHTDELVLDYLAKPVVIFRGGKFLYLISGRKLESDRHVV